MYPEELLAAVKELLDVCHDQNLMLATAESCTGGLIIGSLTAVPGSSNVVDRGFVTYTNQAKNEVLEVPQELLEEYGAVSEQVAKAMAEGALANSHADISVSVTGIAGPGGETPTKPVGLVFFATARKGMETEADHVVFDGDRTDVRVKSVAHAIDMLRARAAS